MDIAGRLQTLRDSALYRVCPEFSAAQDRETVVDGKRMLLFSSNNYLGLASNSAIKEQAIAAVREYGVGSGGSRLTTGTSILHRRLESLLAEFKGSEAALLFGCGYMANVAALSSLTTERDIIFSDALNHASIIDGCRMSRAKTVVYAHSDADDLTAAIRRCRPRSGLVVTDGVFSMDGDIARLPELVQICREHHLRLMVDDAHATGVIGATGRGSLEHFGLRRDDVDIVMGTLSKAAAAEGGFICGMQSLREYMINTARPFIFSTAPAPAVAAAAAGSIAHIRDHPEDVRHLRENVRYMLDALNAAGIPARSESAIIPLHVGDEDAALRISNDLRAMGVFVPCIRYPTVGKGEARLRLTLMATHTRDDMDYAAQCLRSAFRAD
ncbi:MAG: 8-amino-7-oxononanoate synthase [Desulfovibrio sp.]|jgi:8-amino-7-oxononanoate synthase|nr:8-amino-7-oxononanoate synthase [Desulfovibrio sp.]